LATPNRRANSKTDGGGVFHSLAVTLEMPLLSADGEKYAIRNILFDDQSWCIRFLVVDAGKWLSPHPLLSKIADIYLIRGMFEEADPQLL
jgi:hypothetical protein